MIYLVISEISEVMKNKTIVTDKSTLLVVELPQGAYYPNICQLPPYIGVNYFLYENGVNTPYKEPLDIPKGNWQLLSRLPDITGEQASKVVDSHYVCEPWEQQGVWSYKDYCSENTYVWEIYKSLYSLLQVNEVYFENSLGDFDSFDKLVFNHSKDRLREWQEAQSKVWDKERCYLLIKVD